MRSKLVFATALVLAIGCSKKDTPETASPAPTKQALISNSQWCSKYQISGVTVYTRYNFTYDASAYRSNLTQDRIVDRGNGDVQVYKGEALTPWALQDEGSTKGNVSQGYSVELVSDSDKVSNLMRDEGVKPLDDKPIKAALNLYSDFFSFSSANNNKVTRAYPCSSLVDVSQKTPRSFAEFQIRIGQDVRNYLSSFSDATEFWNAMNLQAPIQEIAATPEEISSHAWCSWYASKYRSDSTYQNELQVTVKVFHPNGSMSSQRYVDTFTYADVRPKEGVDYVNARYAELASQADKSTWKIDDKNHRLTFVNKIAQFSLPNTNKLIQDKDGRKGLFSINSEAPDYPLSVSSDSIYYDCAEPVPLKFQNGWSQWLPKIIEFQTSALK